MRAATKQTILGINLLVDFIPYVLFSQKAGCYDYVCWFRVDYLRNGCNKVFLHKTSSFLLFVFFSEKRSFPGNTVLLKNLGKLLDILIDRCFCTLIPRVYSFVLLDKQFKDTVHEAVKIHKVSNVIADL